MDVPLFRLADDVRRLLHALLALPYVDQGTATDRALPLDPGKLADLVPVPVCNSADLDGGRRPRLLGLPPAPRRDVRPRGRRARWRRRRARPCALRPRRLLGAS